MSNHLQQFFKLCDPEGTKSVDRQAFKGLCRQFSIADQEADIIFEDLDHDHDERISFEDFRKGFSDFLVSAGGNYQDSEFQKDSPHQEEANVWETESTCDAVKTCVKKSESNRLNLVLDELESSEKHHLVPYLESTVEELLANLQQLQGENAQLEKTWKKEKLEHESYLKRMEEMMDNQVRETEMKARQKAQEEVEDARRNLQVKMDAEMENLQAHLALFEKVNSWLQTHPTDGTETKLEELRLRLDDAENENRQLRLSLLDTKTSIALVQSQSLQMRNLYEEKCKELMSERVKIREVLNQQEELSQQLTLLHDANRRLQDTNDALRHSMERLNSIPKRSFEVPARAKSGSIIGDYMDPPYPNGNMMRVVNTEEEEENDHPFDEIRPALRRARSVDIAPFLLKNGAKVTDKLMCNTRLNQSDSGFSTTRESQEMEEGYSSTPDSSLPLREDDRPEDEVVKHSTPLKRPVSLPVPELEVSRVEEDFSQKQVGEIHTIAFQEKSLKSSASTGNLEPDDYPKKRIIDIIKQLGIKDDAVRCIPVNRYPKSAETSPTRSIEFTKSNSTDAQRIYSLPNRKPSKRMELQRNDRLRKGKEFFSAGSQTLSIEDDEFPVVLPSTSTPSKDQQPSDGSETLVMVGHKSNCIDEDLEDRPKCKKLLSTSEMGSSVDSGDLLFDDTEEVDYEPNGPAERCFKIIFLGDAGVGKSSFALRISQGVFIHHMSSTLGVDFLMRRMRVDGRNIDVQLWDTAGQERFRSITKPYFRKADGVMLLYDCTSERTFLNVRQWVEDVNMMASSKIPLMIVANKVDLREIYSGLGTKCVSTLDGQKLARDCDTTFMEASAKEGHNVLQALANLVRSMTAHGELQQSASTMHLHEMKKQKQGGCCGR